MRISDWSSDVCSSDLVPANVQIAKALNPTLLPCFVGRSTRQSLFASATSEAFFRSPGKRKSLKTRRAETGAPVIPHPMPAPGVGLWTPRSSEEQHGRRRDRPRNHSRRRIAPSLAPSVAGLARDLQAHLCDERLSQSVADGRRRRDRKSTL